MTSHKTFYDSRRATYNLYCMGPGAIRKLPKRLFYWFIGIFLDEILLVMFSLAAVLVMLLPNGSYVACA